MATASAERPALLTGRGQFHLPQFADALTTNATTADAANPQTSTTLSIQALQKMAHTSGPSVGQSLEHTSSVAPVRQLPQDHNFNRRGSSPHTGLLELVELTSSTANEGVLGPNKDGRVRNPVPSKLKGKTDNKQGNFGVMHMGMSPGVKKNEAQGKDSAAERDAAARRTSENTASRAKAAQQEKYVPPKKRGLEATINDAPKHRVSPFPISRERSRPLAPDETKHEQARLLTLLRSINPITVVDQICKAVAYFGGIPGAPPPEDGIFPESANTRETGALFIGWLAEIFPDVSSRSPELSKETPGSGKKKHRAGRANRSISSAGDVAVEPPNSRNGYGFGPAISGPSWGLPQSLALATTPVPAPAPAPTPASAERTPAIAVSSLDQKRQAEQPVADETPVKPPKQQDDDGNTTTNKRRRGRPKGSTNKKGKGDAVNQGGEPTAPTNGTSEVQNHAIPSQQSQPSPKAQPSSNNMPVQNQKTGSFAHPHNQTSMQNPAPTAPFGNQSWQGQRQKNQAGQQPNLSALNELSREERAVLEALRNPSTARTSEAVPSPVVPVKDPAGQVTGGGQKRKRAPAKPKPSQNQNPGPSPQIAQGQPSQMDKPTANLPQNNAAPMGINKDSLQWTTTEAPAPSAPPAKKPHQRKPKNVTKTDSPSRKQTASVVSNATPPIPPSTIPDSQGTSSQQSVPVTRPPAEGLEAHYERFANMHQQNGRSNTPTVPQQSHVRQHSKTSSVPPQQTTPQLHHQQMQHQKSQQGTQQNSQPIVQQVVSRDDQNITQAPSSSSSSRPSSTPFYQSQRSQTSTTYPQQYPSHQPSQLYGSHQASPQMSTNTSYRSSSSHTLAQTSPQYPQTDNSYRTASPHTISQPSPSYTQPDNSFRNASAHNLAHTTPAYSHSENTYKTPSANSLNQSNPPYAASRSTQPQASHQSHYNNFSDSSYIDLPTLESLGHTASGGSSHLALSAGGFGQGVGMGLNTARSSVSSNSLYGSSSNLNSAFDATTNDLLRGVPRTSSGSHSAYGAAPGLGNSFDPSATSDELRERVFRGMGRR